MVYSKSNFWINIIKFKETKKIYLKKVLKTFLSKKVDVRPVWKCNHLQKPYLNCEKYKIEKAPNLVNKCLCLPSSHSLSKKEFKKIFRIFLEIN